MKTWQTLVFILALIVFVSVSVTISLISISRPPYAFDEKTEIGSDESLSGWILTSFNGNAATKTLTIDYVRTKDGKEPDKTRPVVAVKAYAVNADEYVEELVIGPSVQRMEETSFYNMKKLTASVLAHTVMKIRKHRQSDISTDFITVKPVMIYLEF